MNDNQSTMSSEKLRIARLAIQDVKRIETVEIDVADNGDVVIVGGEVEAGKSSVLDSIAMALGGGREVPVDPIRHGRDEGHITLTVQRGDESYTIERHFKRGDNDHAYTTRLIIRDANGTRISGKPQSFLNRLIGERAIDPSRILASTNKERWELLQRLARIGDDWGKLTSAIQDVYERRTETSVRLRDAEGELASMEQPPDDWPTEHVDIKALHNDLDQCRKRLQHCDEIDAAIRSTVELADLNNRSIKKTREEIENCHRYIAQLESEQKEYAERLEDLRAQSGVIGLRGVLVDGVENAKARILAAGEHQNRVAQVNRYKDATTKVREAQAAHLQLDATIEGLRQERLGLFERAEYPVAGLGFSAGEQDITFRDVLWDQLSTSEKVRLSTALTIAACPDPELPVILIDEGSVLQGKALAAVKQLAINSGFQLWIASAAHAEQATVIIEAGKVKPQSGAPQE